VKLPSLLVVTGLLLVAVYRLAAQPFVRTVALGALIAVLIIAACRLMQRQPLARQFLHAHRFRLLAATSLIAVSAGCGAMLLTQPALTETLRPEQLTTAPVIAEQRGLYRVETDPAGNRYVWTQDRATFVFNFLVHKPITLTFAMRSAAIAGGPGGPVQVIVNGQNAGTLTPDPRQPGFQPLSIRLVPFDWGGERTEVKLLSTPFTPGHGDNRVLGTMLQQITIDRHETWATIGTRRWLIGLPVLFAALAIAFGWLAQNRRSAFAEHGAVVACIAGACCAAVVLLLVLRVGFITRRTYTTWTVCAAAITLCFAGWALLLPLGGAGADSAFQRLRGYARRLELRTRLAAWASAFARASDEPAVTRRIIVRDLLLIVMIAFGIRLVWVFVAPPWQAPDEPEHYLYVKYLVEHRTIPHPPYPLYPPYSQEDMTSWSNTLVGALSPNHPIPGWQGGPVPYLPIGYDYAAARDYQAPLADRHTRSGGRTSNYPPLYYLLLAAPYALFTHAPILSRLYALRCASALLGALSCLFGYLLAFEVRGTRRWGWALGLSMALMPMYAFITATINNDAGMDLCAAALIWLTVRVFLRPALSRRLAVAIGVTSGLALLMKPTIAPLVAVAGVTVLTRLLSTTRIVWPQIRARLPVLGAYAVSAAVVYAPYVLFRLRYFGNVALAAAPFSTLAHRVTGMTTTAAASPSGPVLTQVPTVVAGLSPWGYVQIQQGLGWQHFRTLLVTDFWGDFGWLDAPMPGRFFSLILAVVAIGGIGLLIQLFLQPSRRPVLLFLLIIVITQTLFLFVADYIINYVLHSSITLQGRYFFPVLAPLLLLLLSGWDHLFRERPIGLRLIVLLLAGLQLVGLTTMLARYYGVRIG
jgi:4-amino-4-deoxy-L-arabinose transferase-like glycosyltransferase